MALSAQEPGTIRALISYSCHLFLTTSPAAPALMGGRDGEHRADPYRPHHEGQCETVDGGELGL